MQQKDHHLQCLAPPPLFIHIPFDVLRVILNNAFCEALHAKIQSGMRATITGTPVTEVLGVVQAWRIWEHAPSRNPWYKLKYPIWF